MRNLYLLIFCFFLSYSISAQEVQWAAKVVKFSSEYQDYFYAAKQVIGPPNAMGGNFSDSPFSWSPKEENNEKKNEFIEVEFEKAIHVRQFAIMESLNPGAIALVTLYDESGKGHVVYERYNFKQAYSMTRFFTKKIPLTSYKAKGMKIELNTGIIKGRNQIDAIAISDSDKKISLRADDLEYESTVEYAENLGRHINSKYSERLPIISPDGQNLYFTRKFHPENIGEDDNDDIWLATSVDGYEWNNPTNIGPPVNNDRHNFVVAVSGDNQYMYLASAYKKWEKDGIAMSKKEGDKWGEPQTMKVKDMYNNSQFSGYHVSIDGQVLLMAIERDDTRGDRDIYVSFRNGDEWTAPQNLGQSINSPGMESSIFLAADNKTIYFSSNGYMGHGGLDMYISHRLDDTWQNWSTPKNLGGAINSPGNDFNLTIAASGDYAYFSSDYDSYGQSDLFRINLPKEARPQAVTLVEIADNEEELDGDPDALAPAPATTSNIIVIPLEKGGTIPIQKILFEVNEKTLKNSSYEELDKLVLFLKIHNNITVEIGGHTNGWCSDEYAESLSTDRAKMVTNYLIENGVPKSQLTYKGYGKSKPIATNDTADGRRKNQRVELKILDIE